MASEGRAREHLSSPNAVPLSPSFKEKVQICSALLQYTDYPRLQDTEYREEFMGKHPCALDQP